MENMEDISGKTILVTGSTDGLGKETAKELAGRGATVLVHGRDPERAEATVRDIGRATGNDKCGYYVADLSSSKEIRELAEKVRSEHDRLDVLINNAGVILSERRETEDGVELTFAVNYLAHFLLSRLLSPQLVESGEYSESDESGESALARIVNVASVGQSPIDFEDVMLERSYDPMRAYSQSNLAMIMDAFTLAEELADTGVTVNTLHPATLMDTKMVREAFGHSSSSVEEGVEATVRLAISPDLEGVTGSYFDGKSEARANKQAYDGSARERLRLLSEQLTGV